VANNDDINKVSMQNGETKKDEVLDIEVIDNYDVKNNDFKNIDATIDPRTLDALEAIKLDQVLQDYAHLRDVVLENVDFSQNMIKEIKNEIDIDGFNPELVTNIKDLIQTSNTSMKLVTESYKSIAQILKFMFELKKNEAPKPKDETEEVAMTSDIIARIKKSNTENSDS